LAILTPLPPQQNFPGHTSFRRPEKIRALQTGKNQGLLTLGRDILLEIYSPVYENPLQSLCIANKSWNMKNSGPEGATRSHIGPILKGRQPLEGLKVGAPEPAFRQN